MDDSTKAIENSLHELAGKISYYERQREIISQHTRQLRIDISMQQVQKAYYSALRLIKSPSKEFQLYNVLICVGVPLGFSLVVFIATHVVSGSYRTAFILSCCFAAIALGGCLWLTLATAKTMTLDAWISSLEIRSANALQRIESAKLKIAVLSRNVTQLETQEQRLEAILRKKKREEYEQSETAKLLRKEWRHLRGVPFEEFLARVFRSLNFKVEDTKKSGDQGVDLIVVKGHYRIAIQAKGYKGKVNNSAIQQVVAGMPVYGCNGCAAITNSRFTKSAKQLAIVNNCVLISMDNFREFIEGKVYPFEK